YVADRTDSTHTKFHAVTLSLEDKLIMVGVVATVDDGPAPICTFPLVASSVPSDGDAGAVDLARRLRTKLAADTTLPTPATASISVVSTAPYTVTLSMTCGEPVKFFPT